jgi:hypothetical protein
VSAQKFDIDKFIIVPRKLLDVPRKLLDVPKKLLDVPRKSLDAPRKILGTLGKISNGVIDEARDKLEKAWRQFMAVFF